MLKLLKSTRTTIDKLYTRKNVKFQPFQRYLVYYPKLIRKKVIQILHMHLLLDGTVRKVAPLTLSMLSNFSSSAASSAVALMIAAERTRQYGGHQLQDRITSRRK